MNQSNCSINSIDDINKYIISFTNTSIKEVENLINRYSKFINLIVLYFPTFIPYLILVDTFKTKMNENYKLQNLLLKDPNQFKLKTRFINYKSLEGHLPTSNFFISGIKKINKENKVVLTKELEQYMPAVKNSFIHVIDCIQYLFYAKNMQSIDLITNKKIKNNVFFINNFLNYCDKLIEIILQK